MDCPVAVNDCEPHIAVVRNNRRGIELMPHGSEAKHVTRDPRFDLAQKMRDNVG
jgi:hypothetical protein